MEEVKARLQIERQGETEAFGELAEDLEVLPEKAQAADARLTGLGETLRQLAQVEGLEDVAQDLDAVGEAIQDFEGADSIDQQREALSRLEAAWESFGRKAISSVKDTDQAFRDFQAGLETIRQGQESLADPLTASLEQAQRAVGDLEASLKGGFEGAERQLALAAAAVKRYRGEVEAARKSGKGLADGQVEELKSLEEAYDRAVATARRFRRQQRSTRSDLEAVQKATSRVKEGFSSLDGALESVGGRLGTTASQGLAVAEAFQIGFAAGERLRTSINALTDGALDRFIQKGLGVQALMDRWVGTQSAAADQTDQLRLATLKLVQEGIDPANLSAREILETYEGLRKEWSEATAEALRLDAAYKKFTESQNLSRKGLDEQAKSLQGVIERFRQANAQLGEEQISDIFRKQIQGLLDSYALLGVGAEESFRRQAQGWGVATSAAESAPERQRQLIAALRQDLGAQAEDSAAKIKAIFEVIPQALEGLDLKELELVDPERFERAKKLISELVAAAREVGVEVPKALAEAAGQVGVLVAQIETSGDAFTFFAAGAEQAGEGALQLTEKVDASGRKVFEMTQRVERGSEALGEHGDAAEGARRGLESMDQMMARVEQTATGLAERTEDSAERTSQAGDTFQEAAEKVAAGAEALDQQAQAAASAGDSLGQATTATEGLASAQDSATSSLQGTAAEIETLEERVAQLETQLNAAAQGIRNSFAEVQGFTEPILAELDALIAKAQEAAAALQAVQNGGPA